MKYSASVTLAALAALLLFAACGRVGDPRPPIVRRPQKVENLSAAQSGYKVFLTWTNPSKYIDNTPATDLGMVHIFRDNVEIGMVAAAPAGQPQSFPVDVTNSVGSTLTFTIQMIVPKAEKPSPVSNAVPIQPVPVPGKPRNLRRTVDKGKIVFAWDPPERGPELVEAYVVQRSDKPAPSNVRTLNVEDDYEPGKSYTYTVTAVRGTSPQIAGEGSESLTFVATDVTPPQIPSGFQVQSLGEGNGVFLTWIANTEPDLKWYQVFRSDGILLTIPRVNGVPDPRYVSGRGLSYQILAEDNFGNQSLKSAAQPGP